MNFIQFEIGNESLLGYFAHKLGELKAGSKHHETSNVSVGKNTDSSGHKKYEVNSMRDRWKKERPFVCLHKALRNSKQPDAVEPTWLRMAPI